MMSIKAIALDAGTTSVKAGLLNQQGELKSIITRSAPEIVAKDGRYESDALAYATQVDQVLAESLAQAGGCRIVGLCSQRSSFLIWERSTGRAVTPLISWQDNRGAQSCKALCAHEPVIRSLTGLPLTPYYFAPKLRTLLQENPDYLQQLIDGELLTGTLDTFLIWRWTGGKYHVSDVSMAARTQLMDISQQQWSPMLCDLFGIPLDILPGIIASEGMNLQLDNGLMLTASLADQSAALFASVREEQAEALVNLGTGCFVVRYLSAQTLVARISTVRGYLQTLIYQDKYQAPHFAVEGTLNSIAVALAPYPVDECQVDDLAKDNIFCLAEPSGLGAPYFESRHFAACHTDPMHSDLGIQFSDSVQHLSQRRIAILLLEAVIFRLARILEDFHNESSIQRVYLSGGLSELTCLREGISSCLPVEVFHLQQGETSLQGAALLASGISREYAGVSRSVAKADIAPALHEKYRRWKIWLDGLLDS